MPAVSQQQQKIMGLALSVKRGETPESEVSDDVLKIVNSMSQEELEKYAGTEHDGLPQKVEQKLRETIREIIAMNEAEYVKSKHAPGPYVGFVEVGNGRKKKIREFDTGRGAQVWLTKNAQKFFDKGFKRVGTTRKSDWDNDPFVIKESVNESNISESYRVVAKNKSGEIFKSGIFDKKKAMDLYYKMAKSKKYTSIDIVKESVNEGATRTAMEIGALTGMNKDFIQKFVDANKLDIEKVFQYVKRGKLKDRMDFVTALSGKPNNPIQKKLITMFKESVNEGRHDKDLDKVENAVKNASSFMEVGRELKKAGIKYDFSTSMMPMYRIKISGNTIAIVNKKYAAGAEREVGDVAIGLLENIRVNEAKSYSNKFASWFTGTVLNTVKHPTQGKHQLTADQIQKSPADYKNKLFKVIEKAIKNGDISSADIKKNESVKESSNPKQPVISKANWDRAHKDYKSIRNGQHYMMYMDKTSGATIYGPVTIKESVNEALGTLIPKVGTIDNFELKNLLLKNKTLLDILSDTEYKFLKSDKTDVIKHQSKPFNTIVTDGKLEFEIDLKTRKVIKPLTKARREILNYYSTNKSTNESVKEAKMSDALFVADQLVNGVDDGHLDKREFIAHLSKETKFGKNELGKVFDAWVKMNFREKDDLGFSNKEMLKWLTQYGIK